MLWKALDKRLIHHQPSAALLQPIAPCQQMLRGQQLPSRVVGVNPHHHIEPVQPGQILCRRLLRTDRKSTRLNSSHVKISYAVFCLKKKMIMTLAMRCTMDWRINKTEKTSDRTSTTRSPRRTLTHRKRLDELNRSHDRRSPHHKYMT